MLKNVRIPPNTNPKSTRGTIIQGILYIESPDIVESRGHTQLHGFIVFENKGTPATNVIDMRGNVSQLPLPPGRNSTFSGARPESPSWRPPRP